MNDICPCGCGKPGFINYKGVWMCASKWYIERTADALAEAKQYVKEVQEGKVDEKTRQD